MRRTRLIHRGLVPMGKLFANTARMPMRLPGLGQLKFSMPRRQKSSRLGDIIWGVLVILLTLYVVYRVVDLCADRRHAR